ncbi:MAG: YeeE/YedE family protein [Granulosicoccus sp.]
MFEQLGFESLSPLAASAIFGIVLGILFGIAAQSSRFCLRRALAGANSQQRSNALLVWLSALGVAIAGTQLSVYLGWIEFSGHRLHSAELPILAIMIGGVLFGIGMILTRGCASRLTVLAGSGNLRALFVLLIFAVAAHATLKGVLAPIRTMLSEITVPANATLQTFIASPTTALTLSVITLSAVILLFVLRPSLRGQLIGGIAIGLLVATGWVGTGLVLQDDFDPITFQSLTFTSSTTEWLFWSIASTSIGAGFGVGLLSGVLIGSAGSALARSEFEWVSFESSSQTGRYIAGAILMGTGGVLAGGCTVGAGLSGVSSLSVSALLALASIVIGGTIANAFLNRGETVQTPIGSVPASA